MTMPTARVLLLASLLLATQVVAGCSRLIQPTLTPVEHDLIAELTRDPFLRVRSILREEDGYLTVTTTQGDTTVHYRLMPATDGGEILIRHLDEQQELPVVWTGDIGTRAPRRGLTR